MSLNQEHLGRKPAAPILVANGPRRRRPRSAFIALYAFVTGTASYVLLGLFANGFDKPLGAAIISILVAGLSGGLYGVYLNSKDRE